MVYWSDLCRCLGLLQSMSNNHLSPTHVIQQLKSKRPRELNTKVSPLLLIKLTLTPENAAGVCEPGGPGVPLTLTRFWWPVHLQPSPNFIFMRVCLAWKVTWRSQKECFLQVSKAQRKEERERGGTTRDLFLLKRSQPFSAGGSERRRWGKRPLRGSLHRGTRSHRSELYPKHRSPSLDDKSLEHKIISYFSYHL